VSADERGHDAELTEQANARFQAPSAVETRFGDDVSRYDFGHMWLTAGASRFSHHFARILVITQADELRVAQMIRSRPLQELYLRYSLRPQPDTILHLLRRQSLAPSSRLFLWQVYEWAFRRLQMLDYVEDLLARCGDKTGTHARCTVEIFASVYRCA
jgi:hypothetical protein